MGKEKIDQVISKFVHEKEFNTKNLKNLVEDLDVEWRSKFSKSTQEKIDVFESYVKLCLQDRKNIDSKKIYQIFDVSDSSQLRDIFRKLGIDNISGIISIIEKNAKEFDLNSLYNKLSLNSDSEQNYITFIDVLNNNKEINLYLSKSSKIILPEIENTEKLTQILEILSKKSLSNNCIIKMNFGLKLSQLEIMRFNILYGLNIKEYNREKEVLPRETKLLKSFLGDVKKDNIELLTSENIKDKIQQACNVVLSTDGIAMQLNHALRFLKSFNIGAIDPKFTKIQKHIDELYKKQIILSESYCTEISPGLYWIIEKVTDRNIDTFRQYIKEQRHSTNEKVKAKVKALNLETGHGSFMMSLKEANKDYTDVWIAYIADKKISSITKEDFKHIEISVPLLTSKNASFWSAAGIARNANYKGIHHKNLSKNLFTYASKFMLEHYGKDGYALKEKFINQPAEVMHIILYNLFAQEGSIFAGDSRNEQLIKSRYRLTLEDYYKRRKDYEEDPDFKNFDFSNYVKNEIVIELLKQQQAINDGKKIIPIIVKGNKVESEDFQYIILNKDNEVIQTIDSNQARGELSWYFKNHPHLYKDSGNGIDISFNTKEVATLANSHFECFAQESMLGDMSADAHHNC